MSEFTDPESEEELEAEFERVWGRRAIRSPLEEAKWRARQLIAKANRIVAEESRRQQEFAEAQSLVRAKCPDAEEIERDQTFGEKGRTLYESHGKEGGPTYTYRFIVDGWPVVVSPRGRVWRLGRSFKIAYELRKAKPFLKGLVEIALGLSALCTGYLALGWGFGWEDSGGSNVGKCCEFIVLTEILVLAMWRIKPEAFKLPL